MKRVNIVTIGVQNLERSIKFFQDLFGWTPRHEDTEKIAFFDMGGWMFALYPRDLLAEDACVPNEPTGFSGITLAHNVIEKSDVAKTLEHAANLGAEVIKPAQDVFWGGHSGYFRDLDGHLWEVAFNPFTPTKEDGMLDLTQG